MKLLKGKSVINYDGKAENENGIIVGENFR